MKEAIASLINTVGKQLSKDKFRRYHFEILINFLFKNIVFYFNLTIANLKN